MPKTHRKPKPRESAWRRLRQGADFQDGKSLKGLFTFRTSCKTKSPIASPRNTKTFPREVHFQTLKSNLNFLFCSTRRQSMNRNPPMTKSPSTDVKIPFNEKSPSPMAFEFVVA